MSGNAIYQGLEEFYGANPERQQSGEAGYGVHWRQDGDRERWRVSYVRDTQEVYAVRLGGHGPGQGIVEVLGTFPADEDAGEFGIYYQGLEAHLDGWAVRCILPGSLGWIRERMELAGLHGGAVPGEATHLLGSRTIRGRETALCGAETGLVHIPRHPAEQWNARVNCPQCAALQNSGPRALETVTVREIERLQDRGSVSCRRCGTHVSSWNDRSEGIRERWPGGAVTWICGWCAGSSRNGLETASGTGPTGPGPLCCGLGRGPVGN